MYFIKTLRMISLMHCQIKQNNIKQRQFNIQHLIYKIIRKTSSPKTNTHLISKPKHLIIISKTRIASGPTYTHYVLT